MQDNETLGGANSTSIRACTIKAQNYFDLAGTYTLWRSRSTCALGVNNLFDNDPPLVTAATPVVGGSNLCPAGPCNGNTYPGTWDALGRLLWVGATIDFLPPKPAPAPVDARRRRRRPRRRLRRRRARTGR